MPRSNKRVETNLHIAVKSEDVFTFLHQQEEREPNPNFTAEMQEMYNRVHPYYSFQKVTQQISRFLNKHLPEFGSNMQLDEYALCEFVKNSFDSYAKKGLAVGEYLVVKAVLQIKNGNLIIKLKDNGAGFLDKEKSNRFTRNEIHTFATKDQSFLGKKRFGLRMLESGFEKLGGKLSFKNRKADGAAVYIEFAATEKKTISKSTICKFGLFAVGCVVTAVGMEILKNYNPQNK